MASCHTNAKHARGLTARRRHKTAKVHAYNQLKLRFPSHNTQVSEKALQLMGEQHLRDQNVTALPQGAALVVQAGGTGVLGGDVIISARASGAVEFSASPCGKAVTF